MFKIIIPNNNILERTYILDVIFNEFLEVEYQIVEDNNNQNWSIKLENGATLVFEDHFFNKHLNDLEYLQLKNIPSQIKFTNNKFTVESDIPVLYGNDNFEVFENKIICGIDIFASSFFMLTRWEEYVNKKRDEHDRFPAYESLAFKYSFLDRPIVNEYVEMLWNMLKYLGLKEDRQKEEFSFINTHDVDIPFRFRGLKYFLKEFTGDVLKRRNYGLALENLVSYSKTLIGLIKDPYDTFDYLMQLSEKKGIKSYFFFMAKGLTKYDNYYKSNDKKILNIIEKIKSRGHYIGIHPTYNAYKNQEQFLKEKQELENNFQFKIKYGREHFLRFEIPTTWQIWEDDGMKWDSSMCYADKEGFRCGVCNEYSVFNVLTRKKLNLKEKPLIVMDGSFQKYQNNISPEEMEIKIFDLIDKVKKYNGEFVFLWHNSSFNTNQWKKYQKVYERVLL